MLEIVKRTFISDLKYFKGELYIQIGEYGNKRMGITLHDVIDGSPIFKATLNFPDAKISDNEIIVKDYSENEGMLQFLQENKIVGEVKRYVKSGYIKAPVVELNTDILK